MKDKLKEINGKYYQECDVVMLPSNEKVEVYTKNKNVLCIDFQTSILRDNLTLVSYPNRYRMKPQHLYFLSNEEIEEGDWFMNRQYMIEEDKEEYAIWRCGDIAPNSNPKKIIATTDLSLGLPQPSKEFIQAFIRAYNEGKPITKVLVEYIYPNTINFGNCIYKEINGDGSYYELINGEVEKTKSLNELINLNAEVNFRLKVNSSNEITIKKIKEFYTREEVVELCKSAFITGTRENDIDYFEWERRNL